jgi:hypothetical protein
MEFIKCLKTLSVHFSLCPDHVGLTVPYRLVVYVGDLVPFSLFSDRTVKLLDAVFKSLNEYLPC